MNYGKAKCHSVIMGSKERYQHWCQVCLIQFSETINNAREREKKKEKEREGEGERS